MKAKLNMESIVSHFDLPYRYVSHSDIRSGIINQTYLVNLADDTGNVHQYVFQKINTKVFSEPYHVMDNIIHITEHIKRHLIEQEGSYSRRVLSYVFSRDSLPYYESKKDGFWRAYEYIDRSVAYNLAPSSDHFFEAGYAFGQFQMFLSDYDASSLYETIPHFHNTVKRMEAFHQAIDEDRAGRLKDVQAEVDFILSRESEAGIIVQALNNGTIPFRVTHNDTKINNVLFDTDTEKAICVIDLDTVMPGSSLYDFGDAIRSGASTAAEDERNLDLVEMDLNRYRLFTKGFIKGTHNLLTQNEIELMPLSAKILTLELSSRFLADYLNGDEYFHIDCPEHNLLRTRTQIKLVSDMEHKMEQMKGFAKEYSEKYAARFLNSAAF